MDQKLFGMGLANIFALFILFIIMIVVLKVALTKHPVKGISEFVQNI
ncbi:hypothetical protein MKY96_33795 [Paenibacillus sp. FSL R7-0302]